MKQYDLIVIGGGPGGTEAAAIAAARGQKVALVEADSLGGTCLNRGCVPTKCLCAAAGRLAAMKDYAEFGINVEGISADYAKAHSRATEVVDGLREDLTASLGQVDIVYGEARLGEGRMVAAGTEFMKGRNIIVATGSKPAPLRVPGNELAISSDDLLRMDTAPKSIVIVGGGVIGLEFASVLAAYGTEVTVLEYCREILPAFDAELAKRLRGYLGRRGVSFAVGAEVTEIARGEDGLLCVKYSCKGKEKEVIAEVVLGAVGRRPVVPEGLVGSGVKLTERGFVDVDDVFRTSADGIYAIGDVNGKCMLAHAASAQARVVTGLTDAIGAIPSVVFTVPEFASVGAKEDDAEGLVAAKVPYSASAKALAEGHTDGLVKLVAEQGSGRIVGCQAVGHNAADLIAEATVLIEAGCTAGELAHKIVSAHPSLSELLQIAAARLAAE